MYGLYLPTSKRTSYIKFIYMFFILKILHKTFKLSSKYDIYKNQMANEYYCETHSK